MCSVKHLNCVRNKRFYCIKNCFLTLVIFPLFLGAFRPGISITVWWISNCEQFSWWHNINLGLFKLHFFGFAPWRAEISFSYLYLCLKVISCIIIFYISTIPSEGRHLKLPVFLVLAVLIAFLLATWYSVCSGFTVIFIHHRLWFSSFLWQCPMSYFETLKLYIFIILCWG